MDFYSVIKPLYYICKLSGVATYSMQSSGGFTVRVKDKLITLALSLAFLYINLHRLNDYFGKSNTVVGTFGGIWGCFDFFNNAVTFLVMYAAKKQVIGCFEGLRHVDFCLQNAVGSHPEYSLAKKQIVWCITTYLLIISFSIAGFAQVLHKSIWQEFGIDNLQSYLWFFTFYAFSSTLNMSKMSLLYFFVLEIKKRFEHINTNLFSREHLKIRRLMEVSALLRNTSRQVNSIFQLTILAKIVIGGIEVVNTLFNLCTGTMELFAEDCIAIFILIWSCGSVLEIVFIVYGFWSLRVEVRDTMFYYF